MTSRSDPSSTWADQVIAESYRADWGRLLALLVARTRRLDLAEDALSEAFARASERWPTDGVPANPGGWLYTTASRLILGGLRAEARHGRKAPLLTVGRDWVGPPDVDDLDDLDVLDDERLALVLLCCHPALHPEARSPLALRLVIGTTTEEMRFAASSLGAPATSIWLGSRTTTHWTYASTRSSGSTSPIGSMPSIRPEWRVARRRPVPA